MERFKDEWPLLQVHRQYGKDEAMKLLFDEISALKFKIGEQLSEINELKHSLLQKNSKKIKVVEKEVIAGVNGKTSKAWKKEELVEELHRQIKAISKNKQKWQDDCIKWRNLYCDLVAKTEKV